VGVQRPWTSAAGETALHDGSPTSRGGSCLRGGCEASDGGTLFEHAYKLGLEGTVSKRRSSPYRSGRSPHWLNAKNPESPAARPGVVEDWGSKGPVGSESAVLRNRVHAAPTDSAGTGRDLG